MPGEPSSGPSSSNGWQDMAQQSMKAWGEAGTQVAQTVAQSLLAGQTAMGRVIELTSDAWKAMAPPSGTDGDWQAVLENFSSQVRQFALGLPTSPGTAGDVVQLWQLYVQQIQELSQPWLRLMTRDAPAHLGRAFPSEHSELLELSSHYWDAYERTIGRLLGSPSLGYSRELNHRLAEGFDAWQEFLRAGFEYRVVMSDAWVNAFKQTMQRLNERGERGQPVASIKQLIEVWTDTADEAFTQVFESKRYIDAQARLLNSAMALRRKQQEIVDNLLKGSYVPSRSELDEAYRSIYELRKEMRELKKQLAAKQDAAKPDRRPAVAATRASRSRRPAQKTSRQGPKRRSR